MNDHFVQWGYTCMLGHFWGVEGLGDVTMGNLTPLFNDLATCLNKSALLPLLNAGTCPQTRPDTSAVMLGAMALIRSYRQSDIPETFAALSSAVFSRVVSNFRFHSRVDFIIDTYVPLSIKNVERSRRVAG